MPSRWGSDGNLIDGQFELTGSKQQSWQTHNAVSVAFSGSSNSVWIDTYGYDKVSLNLKNDAATASWLSVFWSADGATQHGLDANLMSNTSQIKSITVDTKMRYMQIVVVNNDAAAAHTMSAWAYLKA